MDSRVERLHLQAHSLVARTWRQGGGTNCIEEALVLDREALELCPPGHPKRSVSLTQLSSHLNDRYNQLGALTDLEEAIILCREALELCPPGHPHRSLSLDNLGVRLTARYDRLGSMEDLNKAIVLGRDALVLLPMGHPSRSVSLNNLAGRLFARYGQLGEMEDLSDAIVLGRDALMLRPLGHPHRSASLDNLAISLGTRYQQLGAMEDLNEAIVLRRYALALRPPGHPERSSSLDNIAVDLYNRYKQLKVVDDLHQAIFLARDALVLRPPGHPHRSVTLDNLATFLRTRYQQLGKAEDLNEAIVFARDALLLRPPGHPLRSASLDNLATFLHTRSQQLGKMEDLSEAIVLRQDAPTLRPPGHPERAGSLDNLAFDLCTRYKRLGDMEDINQAIVLARDALALRLPGHPHQSVSVQNLVHYLHIRFKHSSQPEDKDEIFSLFAKLADVSHVVSSADLSAGREWIRVAEGFRHPTTLLAYQTLLRLLIHHLTSLPSLPRNLTILKNLTSSLAVDAFSACLRNSSPISAVELLEQGRGVFWSRLTQLRSPLDDVISSGLAGKKLADAFTELTTHIRNALHSPDAEQHNRVCVLNVRLEGVITNIRKLPGHSRFLLPSLFSDLQHAACEGPVIILNASKYSCDALVVLVDQDPVHIRLSITKERVQQLTMKLRSLIKQSKSTDVAKDLCILLREVWDQVVSPIVDFLRTIRPLESRIWWCPTAEFSLLPLHAAGPYRKGQRKLADLYISSYTPTLTALIHARRHEVPYSATRQKRFIGIGQATAKGASELVSVAAELASIRQRVDGLATFTCIEGSESCIARVAEELGKNDWVHFACHGIPNRKQPFESAFALRDGRFTIESITRCELENPEFAYLSACHTTVGDEESPDEVIHLASAMQFAGFRSVIGTMWAVDDETTNKIVSKFYDYMKDGSGGLDHTRAAYALNRTMKKVVDIPFDQRILYIHLGA